MQGPLAHARNRLIELIRSRRSLESAVDDWFKECVIMLGVSRHTTKDLIDRSNVEEYDNYEKEVAGRQLGTHMLSSKDLYLEERIERSKDLHRTRRFKVYLLKLPGEIVYYDE